MKTVHHDRKPIMRSETYRLRQSSTYALRMHLRAPDEVETALGRIEARPAPNRTLRRRSNGTYVVLGSVLLAYALVASAGCVNPSENADEPSHEILPDETDHSNLPKEHKLPTPTGNYLPEKSGPVKASDSRPADDWEERKLELAKASNTPQTNTPPAPARVVNVAGSGYSDTSSSVPPSNQSPSPENSPVTSPPYQSPAQPLISTEQRLPANTGVPAETDTSPNDTTVSLPPTNSTPDAYVLADTGPENSEPFPQDIMQRIFENAVKNAPTGNESGTTHNETYTETNSTDPLTGATMTSWEKTMLDNSQTGNSEDSCVQTQSTTTNGVGVTEEIPCQ